MAQFKSTLTTKQTQDLKLSPQQIQYMKLLQVPVAQLAERIKDEIEGNPLLEEGPASEDELYDASEELETRSDEPLDLDDDYVKDYLEDDPISYKERTRRQGPDQEFTGRPIEADTSFNDYLEAQRRMLELDSSKEELIADQIIGSIDADGYLRREPQAIAYDLLINHNIDVTEAEVERVLSLIQGFDPPGIAARDLQECLLLQLQKRLDEAEADQQACIGKAIALIRDHFETFTKKKYDKLQQQLGIDEDQLRQVVAYIQTLNPKPTTGLDTGHELGSNQVIPDFIITNQDGELQLRMNSRNAPALHVSDHYRDLFQKYRKARKQGDRLKSKEKETLVYLKEKMDAARWFIDAIQQRQDTLYRTMHAIMMYQEEYFLTGDERKIQPMILKDIADITDLDISTISRVVNSKWVQTEYGTKRLKELFSESLQTDEGEEVSTLQVKNVLAEIIDQEDKRHPLPDKKLTELLKERGYQIARRTVAKYREQLGLPVARMRKEL